MCNKEIISRYIAMNELEPSIELHTFAEWKRLGYKVKKGEKSKHKISIWKRTTKKVENEKGEEVETQNYFLKLLAFFTKEQVEKLEVD
jgi:antirestriction protein ArdC